MKKLCLFLSVLLTLSLFCGCDQNEKTEILKTPPKLTVSTHGSSINAIFGTYVWNYQNGDRLHQDINDSIDPLLAIDIMEHLEVNPSTFSAFEPYSAQFSFEKEPKSVHLSVYEPTESEGENIYVTLCIDVNDDLTFKLRPFPAVYVVEATFDEKNYSGKVEYYFYAEINNLIFPDNTLQIELPIID